MLFVFTHKKMSHGRDDATVGVTIVLLVLY